MEIFSQLSYSRPDFKLIKKQLRKIVQNFQNASGYEEAKACYFRAESLLSDAYTMGTIAHIRNSLHTADSFYAKEMKILDQSLAMLMPLVQNAINKFLASPYSETFEKEYGSQIIRMFSLQQRLYSRKIIFEQIKEGRLKRQYRTYVSRQKIDFQNSAVNFYGLLQQMENPDRSIRKAAFLTWADTYEKMHKYLDQLYDQLISVRLRMTHKLGFEDYTALAYLKKYRMDYTREDVAGFREQILRDVVPAVSRLMQVQRERLGVDTLQFYDESLVFREGNANPVRDQNQLIQSAAKFYHGLSPETDTFFSFMQEYQLFDLETRLNKQSGGYCTALIALKAPYIFANFNGTAADVGVLTHEAGHAYAGFRAMRTQPLLPYLVSTSEINEIQSMAMEHFAYPWYHLFFGEAAAEKARYIHLLKALSVMPYIAAVDEFQHKIYEIPHISPEKRNHLWRSLEKKYMPWRNYDGNPFLESGGFWMQKLHIFLHPFYYIDYALAQTCAFELYGKMKENPDSAWHSYQILCKAGGSMGYFELLQAAGLRNPFSAESVKRAVGHVIQELEDAF